METETTTLKLDQIRIDGGTQPRVVIDEQVVAEYAEIYSTGTDLPPVTVFFDGTNHWLADGFHRYWANKRIGCEVVLAEVHPGMQRDAILYSVGANAGHGLRRTNADKRKAVLTLLEDPKVSHDDDGRPWSDRAIASRCRVSPHTVVSTRSTVQMQSAPVRKTSDGRTMNTSRIGRTKRKPKRGGISPAAMKPVRQPRPALAQTHINLPHDPSHGARAIVSAMGEDYARRLIDSLTAYLQKEGEA